MTPNARPIDELTKVVGERIALLRRRVRLTQADLADRAGLSKSGLEKIERGVSCPRLDRLGWIATALRVSPHDIICDGEKVTDPRDYARLDTLLAKHRANPEDVETFFKIMDAVFPAIQSSRSRGRKPLPPDE